MQMVNHFKAGASFMNKFKLVLVCFLSLSIFAENALAQNKSEWVVAGSGETKLSFIDSKSVKGERDHLVGWLVSYSNDLGDVYNGRIVGYSLVSYAWDCHTRKYAIFSVTAYDRKMRLIGSSNEVPYYALNWRSVVPDTIGESQLETACYYAPSASYYKDLPEIIRKRRESGLEDYYVAESVEEVIGYANTVMPWTNSQGGATDAVAPRRQLPKVRKK